MAKNHGVPTFRVNLGKSLKPRSGKSSVSDLLTTVRKTKSKLSKILLRKSSDGVDAAFQFDTKGKTTFYPFGSADDATLSSISVAARALGAPVDAYGLIKAPPGQYHIGTDGSIKTTTTFEK